MIHVRGWAANSINKRVRLQSKFEAANSRIAQLREELRIKDQRMERRMVRKLSPMLFRVDLNLAWFAGACLMVPLNSMLIQSE